MNGNKLGKFIIMGAMVGAAVSMFDRSTRRQVSERSRGLARKSDSIREIRIFSDGNYKKRKRNTSPFMSN